MEIDKSVADPKDLEVVEPQDWTAWVDGRRHQIALAVFAVFFAIYGMLVYTSGTRALTPLEQASLAMIGVVISGVFGIVLGVPFARRRVKIASQLRRAYGISQNLRSVQRDVEEAAIRMKRRTEIKDPVVIGEFWEEIVGNIRIALRAPIFETERMVEDWGEMDPIERARIQAEEKRTTQEIQKLTVQLESARSVEKDLEGVSGVGASLSAAVDRLEQRVRDLQEAQPGRALSAAGVSVRALLDQGQYREAIEFYDDVVRRYPRVHTNYIGRAKARYLGGDVPGALADLETARGIFAGDPAIASLQSQISAGRAATSPLPSTAKNEAIAGNQALSNGDADAAARHYTKAEELGWNPFFAKFNLAMTDCLRGEFRKALSLTDELTADDDSFMALNKLALVAICRISADEDVSEILEVLRKRVLSAEYDYSRSPIRYLEAGLQTKDELYRKTQPVFEIIKQATGTERPNLLHPTSA